MKIQAISRNVRISPRKVRLVADAVRNLSVGNALVALKVTRKRAGVAIAKTIESALANAVNNSKLDKGVLSISDIEINEGQALKRFHPSTRGRIHPYKKRSSHIRVILEERISQEVKKAEPKIVEKRKEDKKL